MVLVGQVELEMAIDSMSPNYCSSKGEQIALNVDGTSYDETNTYSAYVKPVEFYLLKPFFDC